MWNNTNQPPHKFMSAPTTSPKERSFCLCLIIVHSGEISVEIYKIIKNHRLYYIFIGKNTCLQPYIYLHPSLTCFSF